MEWGFLGEIFAITLVYGENWEDGRLKERFVGVSRARESRGGMVDRDSLGAEQR